MAAPELLSIEDTLAALPVRKSRRWLVEFLHSTKTDPHGRPLYRTAGRDKLVYLDRVIEALPQAARNVGVRARRAKPPKYQSDGSQAIWARAAELTGDPTLAPPAGTYRRTGDVYFIEAGDLIKIGFTRSPVGRMRTIKTGCPLPMKLLHHEAGSLKSERELHRRFAVLRVRGEWFRKAPELLAYIKQRKG